MAADGRVVVAADVEPGSVEPPPVDPPPEVKPSLAASPDPEPSEPLSQPATAAANEAATTPRRIHILNPSTMKRAYQIRLSVSGLRLTVRDETP